MCFLAGGRFPGSRACRSRAFPNGCRRSVAALSRLRVTLARSQWRVRAGFKPDFPFTTDPYGSNNTRSLGWLAVTVNLTKIYTRLGDDGQTHLGDMSRVTKLDPRIEAYGTVDELNAQIGVALSVAGMPEPYLPWLRHIQNDLFDVGADLSVPQPTEKQDEAAKSRLRVLPEQVTWLEQRCDEVNAELQPLKSFVLPGGTAPAAQLHVCRTVCRRAERRTLLVEDGNPEVVRYLNRCSDLLFILSRGANAGDEPLWQPGRFR